jgi:hypothetical protein
MKPISKKVIEAGLVPKHTLLLMQRWGYMDPETDDIDQDPILQTVHSDLKEGFAKFVDELDELLEAKQEEDIKETSFSLLLKNPFRIMWLSEKYGNYSTYGDPVVVFKDDLDRLVFPASEECHVGRMFSRMTDESWFEITEVTPLWADDTLAAYQVEVELVR